MYIYIVCISISILVLFNSLLEDELSHTSRNKRRSEQFIFLIWLLLIYWAILLYLYDDWCMYTCGWELLMSLFVLFFSPHFDSRFAINLYFFLDWRKSKFIRIKCDSEDIRLHLRRKRYQSCTNCMPWRTECLLHESIWKNTCLCACYRMINEWTIQKRHVIGTNSSHIVYHSIVYIIIIINVVNIIITYAPLT